ncbi:hypothetical protein PC116_g25641 [Phytophthora cactorum]|uniref:Uncharacterized protein n=1 Tax=Phytophthora cactorum TaxID=29920 RepID=A0A8T1JRI2_9STRA|nr:hypothetical protein PC111_g20234 [Phytophthora cactorum]KAG2807974.1 hypothetical protein PC112_g17175 [Phytophthora cactorum]KAG2832473.1 hypothetical protein PC113_g20733 [Phytophthora cactorum]KAG2924741.1 hypothetical protein PC117_g15337 [Phytophthora cactorum]KAG2962724.1 hypothetical protein PC118_g21273 [Phytophthora cactorum]
MSSRLTAAEIQRVRAFRDAAIDREEHGTPSEDARTLQQQLWTEMRVHLRSNAMSTGLEHLGQLAEDVMDHKTGIVLRGTVLVLLAPPAANVPSSTVPSAPIPAESPVPPSRKSSNGKKPARSKRKAGGGDSTVKPLSKKSCSTSKSKKDEQKGTVSVPSAAFATLLDVNAKAPKYVRAAIAAVLAKAEAAGKKP